MCEDTVFWDLNYAIKYKSLGTEEIRSKVLKLMETLDERLFEHPNFVWLDHAAINEILGAKYLFCFLLTIPQNERKIISFAKFVYSVSHIITYPSKELFSKMALGEGGVSLP